VRREDPDNDGEARWDADIERSGADPADKKSVSPNPLPSCDALMHRYALYSEVDRAAGGRSADQEAADFGRRVERDHRVDPALVSRLKERHGRHGQFPHDGPTGSRCRARGVSMSWFMAAMCPDLMGAMGCR
jgi:hypothetical protein